MDLEPIMAQPHVDLASGRLAVYSIPMMFESWSTREGKRVEPGAEWTQPMQDLLRFQLSIKCTRVNPNEFIGTVRLNGELILEGAPANDYNIAWRNAEGEMRQRLIRIFKTL